MNMLDNRIQELFFEAIDYDRVDRDDFLKTACADDPQLRDEVQMLIDAHDKSTDFLETSPYLDIDVEVDEEHQQSSVQSFLPSNACCGSYRLIMKIGEGGAGSVFLAEQASPSRLVAVKLLKNVAASDEQRYRFEYESKILGRLKHPGIAQIYEAGVLKSELGEQPFFSMEYISGIPVTAYIAQTRFGVRDRIDLLRRIAEAVHHAHQKGIIHRDLKPSNVLVEVAGNPKILDFGIARAVERDTVGEHCTNTGQILGTIPYMSPEQCGADPDEVDIRTDVYSLGVLGYQMIAGHEPYDIQGQSIIEQLRIIQEREPTPLGRVNRAYRGDIEIIIKKALSKDKSRRYQSAGALADDLKHYLDGEAIDARLDSKLYLLRKTIRKYRTQSIIAAILLIVICAAAVLVSISWTRASAQHRNAREAVSLTHSFLGIMQDVEDAVRPLAGGIEVSDRILVQVDDNLKKLQPLVESDAAFESVLMTLHEKRGDIAYAQGRYAHAIEHYRSFLQISRNLAENSEDDEINHRLTMARAHRKLGLVVLDPKDRFEKAIELCELEIKRYPKSLVARYELTKTNLDFAQHLFSKAHYERATPRIDDAIFTLESVVKKVEDDYRWKKLQMKAYGFKGRNLFELGQKEVSLESLDQSLEIGESLVQERPADTDLRFSLMETNVRLGIIHYQDQRFEKAQHVLEKAIEIGEYLVNVDPSITAWRNQLRAAHHELSGVFYSLKKITKSQEHCDASVVLAEDLTQLDPVWRRRLASSKLMQGFLLVTKIEWQNAFDAFEEAKDICQDLLEDDAENVALKSDLARAFDGLGRCSRQLGKRDAALNYYTQAHDIRRTLYEAHPDVAQRILDLVLSKTKLATWHYDRRTPEGDRTAEELLNKAKDFLLENYDQGKLDGHKRRYNATLRHINGELDRPRPAEPRM